MNQPEYLPNTFFTLLASKLCNEINDPHGRYNILHVLRETMDCGKFHMEIHWVIYKDYTGGLRKLMWTRNSDTVKALRQGFSQGNSPVRSLVSELYTKCAMYGMSYLCIV